MRRTALVFIIAIAGLVLLVANSGSNYEDAPQSTADQR